MSGGWCCCEKTIFVHNLPYPFKFVNKLSDVSFKYPDPVLEPVYLEALVNDLIPQLSYRHIFKVITRLKHLVYCMQLMISVY